MLVTTRPFGEPFKFPCAACLTIDNSIVSVGHSSLLSLLCSALARRIIYSLLLPRLSLESCAR